MFGCNLSRKTLFVKQWSPLNDKITTKVSLRTNMYLSYTGRLQLLEAVIFSMQSFEPDCYVFKSCNQTNGKQIHNVFYGLVGVWPPRKHWSHVNVFIPLDANLGINQSLRFGMLLQWVNV